MRPEPAVQEEITPGTDGLYTDSLDKCDPSTASPFCPQHPVG
jgi:hypothetical protein